MNFLPNTQQSLLQVRAQPNATLELNLNHGICISTRNHHLIAGASYPKTFCAVQYCTSSGILGKKWWSISSMASTEALNETTQFGRQIHDIIWSTNPELGWVVIGAESFVCFHGSHTLSWPILTGYCLRSVDWPCTGKNSTKRESVWTIYGSTIVHHWWAKSGYDGWRLFIKSKFNMEILQKS